MRARISACLLTEVSQAPNTVPGTHLLVKETEVLQPNPRLTAAHAASRKTS